MKKLVFMFVAVAAISFASCGNKAQNAPVENDTIPEVVENDTTNLGDTTNVAAADTTAQAK